MIDDHSEDYLPEDAELLSSLRRAAEGADPEPAYLRDLGRAAFSVRRVDAELAQLVADSTRQRELVRSGGSGADPRLVTFVTDTLTIEVQVSRVQSHPYLIGLVDGLIEPEGSRVDVEAASGELESTLVDDLGRFTVDDVPRGLIRLRVLAQGVDVTTDWMSLAG